MLWVSIAIIFTPAFILAAIELNPVALVYVAAVGALILALERWISRAGDPIRNCVVLGDEDFEVIQSGLWNSTRVFKYADVLEIREGSKHRWYATAPMWPTFALPTEEHLDIRLSRRRFEFLPSPILWTSTLHMRPREQDAFVKRFEDKVKEATEAG
jgi:hypothetical protein